MTAIVGGEVLSFGQVSPTPPDGATVTYSGTITVPAGAYLLEIYWYTRGEWDTTTLLNGSAEAGGLFKDGATETTVFIDEDVSTVDTGGSVHKAGHIAAGEGTLVANVTIDIVFTITETVIADQPRTGVTLVGAVWITPSVTTVGTPVIT